MTKIELLHDLVLVEPEEESDKTAGGLMLPESAKGKSTKGHVVAVGPGAMHEGKRVAMSVSKGKKVFYKKWGGTEIHLDNKSYVVLKESDIIGVLS